MKGRDPNAKRPGQRINAAVAIYRGNPSTWLAVDVDAVARCEIEETKIEITFNFNTRLPPCVFRNAVLT